jgi:endoglucanase
MQDRGEVQRAGEDYPDTRPAKAYIDHTSSYASNEVCINWNAPLVFVLAYINQQ